jgi:hypothetical protein
MHADATMDFFLQKKRKKAAARGSREWVLTCEESCMQQEERDRARSGDAIFWWPPNRKAAAHLSTGAYLFCVYKPGQSCATEKRKNGRNAAGCHASMHAKPRRRQTPLINRKKQQADAYSLLPRKPSRWVKQCFGVRHILPHRVKMIPSLHHTCCWLRMCPSLTLDDDPIAMS